ISIQLADMDADLDLDLVALCGSNEPRLFYYENQGGDVWVKHVPFDLSGFDSSWGFHAADIDGDGLADVVAGSPQDSTIGYFRNLGDHAYEFLMIDVSLPFQYAYDIISADLDLNGEVDLLLKRSGSIVVIRNVITQLDLTILSGSHSQMALGDLNNDGYQDIVGTTGSTSSEIFYYLNDGAGGFSTMISSSSVIQF